MEESEKLVRALKAEFERRKRLNPKYTLRLFAASFGVSHTLLSLILASKRAPSKKFLERASETLGNSASPKKITPASNDMSLEAFSIISDWHHYAILSLLELPDSIFNEKWIARRLGITEADAGNAMNRLKRMGLVKEVNGRFKQSAAPIRIENTESTLATKKFHQQVIQKSLISLQEDDAKIRDFSGMMMAIDPKLVPFAREKIRTFRRKLCDELEAMGNPKEVYHLAVQFFPISKKK